MGDGKWNVMIGNGNEKVIPDPYSPFPAPIILSTEPLMKPVAEPFYPCLGAAPYCGALIVPGLCGGAMNPYNGPSHFVACY